VPLAVEHVGLTDRQGDIISQLSRGVALWKIGGRSTVVHHIVGPSELTLTSTDARMLGSDGRSPMLGTFPSAELVDTPRVAAR
jgi:hypothetical protein